jgi:hypothetical protein
MLHAVSSDFSFLGGKIRQKDKLASHFSQYWEWLKFLFSSPNTPSLCVYAERIVLPLHIKRQNRLFLNHSLRFIEGEFVDDTFRFVVAQSVQRLTRDWTVRGSNLVGARFFAQALVPTQPPVQWIPGLSRD